MKPRRALVLAHRWFGLTGALWLFLVGLTGAVLVFYAEIDRAINPELFRTTGGAVTTSFDQAVMAVESSRPERQVISFWTKHDAREAWTFRVSDPGRKDASEVYFDPTSGKVLGERIWDEIRFDRAHAMPLLYTFHYSLLAGEWGDWLIGLLGFLWLLDHIVAGILSFPNPRRWAQSLRIRKAGGYRRIFDLHRVTGLWLLVITLTVAVSGTYMNWRSYAEALVGVFSERSPWPGADRPALPRVLSDPPLSFDDAITRAGVSQPQGVAYDSERGLYSVSAFNPADLTTDYGQLYIVVDARNGAVLSRSHIAHGTAADVIDAWQLPLHSGKVFGWPGRILICLSGLALCLFVVTGLLLWKRKRAAISESSKKHGPTDQIIEGATGG